MQADLNAKFPMLAAVIVVFVIPVMLFSAGFRYYEGVSLELEKKLLLSRGTAASSMLPEFSENGTFWANQLNNAFAESSDHITFERRLQELSQRFAEKPAWILWPAGQASYSSITLPGSRKDWLEFGRIVVDAADVRSWKISLADYYLSRRLIGPHLQMHRLYESKRLLRPILIESDFTGHHPLVWGNARPEFAAFVMLPPALSKKKHGIRAFVEHLRAHRRSGDEYIFIGKDCFYSDSSLAQREIDRLRLLFSVSGQKVTIAGSRLIFGELFADGSILMVASRLNHWQNSGIDRLFAILLFLCLVLLARNVSLSQLSVKVNIKTSVYAFIGFSNILPLCLLAFFADQYLEQKYQVLVDEKRSESIRFIQLLESDFQSMIERFPRQVKTAMESFRHELRQRPLEIDLAWQILAKLREHNASFYIVASSADRVLSKEGFTLHGRHTPMRVNRGVKETRRFDDLFMKIGGCFLSFWNQQPVSQKTLTEAELVTDTLFNRPVDEALHLLLEIIDKMGRFGFGSDSRPAFAEVMALHQPEAVDYLGIYQFYASSAAAGFLSAKKKERLGNDYGLKVIFARGVQVEDDWIDPFTDKEALAPHFVRAKDYPPLNADQIDISGEAWVCTGLKSSVIENIVFLALYPVSEIRLKISAERIDLILLILLNFIIVMAVAFFFSNTLLSPVEWLEKGTEAIVERRFSWRLPDLGRDEMGQMAEIFNSTLNDLEELSLARVVQQQLFPQTPVDTGVFSMYGKSVTLAELGGDYFDYFTIDDSHFAAMLGDVAGHGVGAAMIMAIAKSGILNLAEYYRKPAELLTALHRLIHATKTRKQKKIMTFQYLCINSETGAIEFSNAGGCNPALVNGLTGSVEEIVLAAPALGAFKTGRFGATTLQLKPGDALVLYSDGIVEARNSAGEEIGYTRFQQMLLHNWSSDSDRFYHAMLAEYLGWLGEVHPQDDMTMIIICRRV